MIEDGRVAEHGTADFIARCEWVRWGVQCWLQEIKQRHGEPTRALEI